MNVNFEKRLMELKSVRYEKNGVIVDMDNSNSEEEMRDGRREEINDTIEELVTEKRGELLPLMQSLIYAEGGGSLSIADSELKFEAKVRELAAIAARRLKSNESEKMTIQDQITRQIIKELWPTLCLIQYAEELKSKQFEELKTQALVKKILRCAIDAEKLSQAKTLKIVRLAQKILSDNITLAETISHAEFKNELKKLLEDLGEETSAVTAHSWWNGKIANTLSRFVSEGVVFSPAEQVERDFQFLQHFGARIRRLGQQGRQIAKEPSTSVGDPELSRYLSILSEYEEIIDYLDDLCDVDKDFHLLGWAITDQIFSLEETGRGHFSTEPYEGMVEHIHRVRKLACEYRENSKCKRLIALVDRTSKYEINEAAELMDELMEQLLPALRIEFEESLEHFKADNTSGNRKALLAVVNSCKQWVNKVKTKPDQKALLALQAYIIANLPSIDLVDASDCCVSVEEFREIRKALTPAQVEREWKQRRIALGKQPLSDKKKTFLNFFFFLLQAGAPILDVISKPIAKMDYNYYLGMMAEAAHDPGSTPEDYDFYLAKAREFWGGNEDFLDSYDDFLRGKLTVSYSPYCAEDFNGGAGGLLHADENPTEAIHDWIKGFVPEAIAQWTAAFLGLTPEGKMKPQLTAWEHWANYRIAPQLRDNYFSKIISHFEQIAAAGGGYQPSDLPESQFGFHCYKMYESLKDSSDHLRFFEIHLKEAQGFAQFSPFLQDYCTYLQEHPPEITFESSTPPPFVAIPIQPLAAMTAEKPLVSPVTSSAAPTYQPPFSGLSQMMNRGVKVASMALKQLGSWIAFTSAGTAASSCSSVVDDTSIQKKEEVKLIVEHARAIHEKHALSSQPPLEPLRELVSLSLAGLLDSMRDLVGGNLSTTQLDNLLQQIQDQCFDVKELEKLIETEMDKVRETIRGDAVKLEAGGKKYANIVLKRRLFKALGIPGIKIPVPVAMKNDRIQAFLRSTAPEVFTFWEQLGGLYSSYNGTEPFLSTESAKQLLASIDAAIERAFNTEEAFEALQTSPKLQSLLEKTKASKGYLIVRSSGSEDSKEVANAGGNLSVVYVKPEKKAWLKAVGDVVRSFFSVGSLQNRLNPGQNPFEEELKLSVTTQKLIGEPVGGAANPKMIPTSVVLFSNEPLFIGGEAWRLMRISATHGHGEGVVGNMGIATDTYFLLVSEAEPDKLYILRDIKDKPYRLAPIELEEGNPVLDKLENPLKLRYTAALDDELLIRLYHMGVISEKFFQYHADMELVILDGVIYAVQARPVNRPEMLPTFVDMHKVAAAELSPIIQTLRSDVLVTGKASVVVATSSEQVVVAAKLQDAERLYNKDLHRIVIVHQEEPANSHLIVNFSNLGVPCFFSKDSTAVQSNMHLITTDHPLAICSQTGNMHLWDSDIGKVEDYVSAGFAIHPARLAISLPKVLVKASNRPLREVPEEVKGLLIDIREAVTERAAREAIDQLQQNSWVADVKSRAAFAAIKLATEKELPTPIRDRLKAIAHFATAFNQAIAEAEAAAVSIESGHRLQSLFHAKVIATLLEGREDKGGSLGQISMLDVVAIDKDLDQLLDYQKQLTHPPHLLDLVLVGNTAITAESSEQWRQFLMGLEPLIENRVVSQEKLRQLLLLVDKLQGANAMTTWLTFHFGAIFDKWQGVVSDSLIDELIQTLPADDDAFVAQQLSEIEKLSALYHQGNSFAEKTSFDKAWKTLQQHADSEIQKRFAEQMKAASPVGQLIAMNTMLQLIDTFDNSIKAMLVSSDFSRIEKVPLLKQMLLPFFDLLNIWHQHLIEPGAITTHSEWPVDRLLWVLKSTLEKFPTDNEWQLDRQSEFSVDAALFNSRDAIEFFLAPNLEAMFSVIHQNLILCQSILMNAMLNSVVIDASTLPLNYKRALETVTARYPMRTAMEVTEKGAIADYNIPLRAHSAKLKLAYETTTGGMTVTEQFFGVAFDRWSHMKLMGALLHNMGILTLHKPIHQHEREVAISWCITDQSDLNKALALFEHFCDYSMGSDNLQKLFIPIIGDTTLSIATVNPEILIRGAAKLMEENYKGTIEVGIQLLNIALEKNDAAALLPIIETIAISFANGRTPKKLSALSLCSFLVDKDYIPIYNAATEIALKGFIDSDGKIRETAQNLLELLMEKKHMPAFDAAIEIAKRGIWDHDLNVRLTALQLFQFLVEKNHKSAYICAAEGAVKGVIDKDSKAKDTAFQLLQSLFEKNDAAVFDLVLEIAQKDILDNNMNVRNPALQLFQLLFSRKYGPAFEAATEAAKKGIFDSDWYVRKTALSLFRNLFNKNHMIAFEAANETVAKGFLDNNPDIRGIAQELQNLIDQNVKPPIDILG